jgi:protein-serine/threonine kinase
MSSAAIQATPHQSTTVPALSPTTSPANRQYTSQPSHPKDPYYNQQPSNASPSSTTRKPSRRPSGGNGASPNSQQQPQYYSPTGGAPSSAPKSSKSSNTSAQASQTAALNSSPSVNPATASIEYQRGVPPVAPPRTSSNQRSGAALATASAADHSRRNEQARTANTGDGPQDRVESGRRRQVNGNEREIINDDAAAAAREASRSRRREQQSPHATQPQRANSSREPRSAEATQGRSQAKTNNAPTATPNGLSREGSEILNRVVVSKPEVDLERERERERMAEAQAPSATSDYKQSSGLNVVGSEGVDDAGRGGSRSRHENTTSSKREKNTRLGEYYLGNTLGEGEFGKVKMGWKQEGGVQVSKYDHIAPEITADNRRWLSNSFDETV